ncbi:MAG: tandem-95 repeat protein, partial [Ignavibacteria bacterium]|nr:tandem-95 repeat protein [Ignavibacteria bacterium]
GIDTFVYIICDDGGPNLCDTANVFITVNHILIPPNAIADSANTCEEIPVTINVVANDFDVDGNLLLTSVQIVIQPQHGTCSVNTISGAVTYMPSLNYNGTDEFCYKIFDNENQSSIACVTISICPIPDAPIAIHDTASTCENQDVNINLLANDFDADGNLLINSVQIITTSQHGSTFIDAVNHIIVYSPDTLYHGIDNFCYSIADSTGLMDTACVEIFICSVDIPPVAVIDTASTCEEIPVTVDVLANDFDTDGTIVLSSVQIVSQPVHGTCSVNTVNGNITYWPELNYNGTDVFCYRVMDNEAASIRTEILNDYDVKQEVFYAEIDLEILFQQSKKQEIKFKEPSKYPMMRRDLAMLLPKEIKYEALEKIAFL